VLNPQERGIEDGKKILLVNKTLDQHSYENTLDH
jgi:hypothetical protein